MNGIENNSIRCLLLAAGIGSRLRPLTYNVPKCLIEVGGRPILDWWLKHLELVNCKEVIVNTHYHADQVKEFLKGYQNSSINIIERYEETLLGTAGTLLANAEFFQEGIGILIHADNATDFDLKELIEAHMMRPKDCLVTMLTFQTDKPENCGIVEVNTEGVVQGFYEKVENPPGRKANGAVYIFDKRLIEFLDKRTEIPYDFSTDVLPRLIGRIYTYETRNHFIDIGTPDNLIKARRIWPNMNMKKL